MQCTWCVPGTYSNVGGSGCITCPANYKCPFGGADAPIACESERKSDPGSSVCDDYLDGIEIFMIILFGTLGLVFCSASCISIILNIRWLKHVLFRPVEGVPYVHVAEAA